MSSETVLKLRERGEITIPKDIREEMNLKPGDLIQINKAKNGVCRIFKVIPAKATGA